MEVIGRTRRRNQGKLLRWIHHLVQLVYNRKVCVAVVTSVGKGVCVANDFQKGAIRVSEHLHSSRQMFILKLKLLNDSSASGGHL